MRERIPVTPISISKNPALKNRSPFLCTDIISNLIMDVFLLIMSVSSHRVFEKSLQDNVT